MASEGKSFWKTLPGVLAATAGFLSAIAGILGAAHELGWLPGIDEGRAPTDTAFVEQTSNEETSENPIINGAAIYHKGNTLFADTFVDDSGKWPNDNAYVGGGIRAYAEDQYHIYAPPGFSYTAQPTATIDMGEEDEDRDPVDVSVQVEAARAGPLPGSVASWGVICRGKNDSYYQLGVTSDGRGLIVLHTSNAENGKNARN